MIFKPDLNMTFNTCDKMWHVEIKNWTNDESLEHISVKFTDQS